MNFDRLALLDANEHFGPRLQRYGTWATHLRYVRLASAYSGLIIIPNRCMHGTSTDGI